MPSDGISVGLAPLLRRLPLDEAYAGANPLHTAVLWDRAHGAIDMVGVASHLRVVEERAQPGPDLVRRVATRLAALVHRHGYRRPGAARQ